MFNLDTKDRDTLSFKEAVLKDAEMEPYQRLVDVFGLQMTAVELKKLCQLIANTCF